jgi:hypothetical protein
MPLHLRSAFPTSTRKIPHLSVNLILDAPLYTSKRPPCAILPRKPWNTAAKFTPYSARKLTIGLVRTARTAGDSDAASVIRSNPTAAAI